MALLEDGEDKKPFQSTLLYKERPAVLGGDIGISCFNPRSCTRSDE